MISTAGPPSALASIGTTYRALLRSQLGVWRLIGLAVLSLIAVPLALLGRGDLDQLEIGTRIIAEYSIGAILPVTALLVSTNGLANLIEDNLLVYLWMKPQPKWHIAVAVWAVTLTLVLPLVAVPTVLAASVTGIGSSLITSALITALLGAAAYGAVFTMLSAQFSRALWIGLIYVVVWENLIARIGNGTARLSVRSYLLSYISDAVDYPLSLANRAGWSQIVIPALITVAALAVAGWRLARRDVA